MFNETFFARSDQILGRWVGFLDVEGKGREGKGREVTGRGGKGREGKGRKEKERKLC